MKVKRTERGWPGHFLCADQCSFRRNTLLEYKNKKIVVSTIGAWYKNGELIKFGGYNSYYETMVFHAEKNNAYHDIDVDRIIEIYSPWCITKISNNIDIKANEMHETAVDEITLRLKRNKI